MRQENRPEGKPSGLFHMCAHLLALVATIGGPVVVQLKTFATIASLMLFAPQAVAAKEDPYANPGGAYERLLDCYATFMTAKGFDIDTDEAKVHRWDRAAMRRCHKQYRALERLLGPDKTRSEWRELWTEYWSRL
ncbi:hypothetical protein [Novosphingobium cyanobacteriorum]|uniref:Uncharacterized protein n=1 Tax=Novosphingobium cyanobacteriorum TaxID=3024215 RepID=A0ABT6CKH8_9SPHN|nr:hypothetical protein [Novosphingobium cyanobacteriorum]MDF8332852.1 hypothetical protein [Novosphingobium cyanobacteriorum]